MARHGWPRPRRRESYPGMNGAMMIATILLALAAFSFISIDGFLAAAAPSPKSHIADTDIATTTPESESKSGSATNLKLYYTDTQEEPVPVAQTSGSAQSGPGSLFGLLLRRSGPVDKGLSHRQGTQHPPLQHPQHSLEDERNPAQPTRKNIRQRALSPDDLATESEDGDEGIDAKDNSEDDLYNTESDGIDIDTSSTSSSSRSSTGTAEFTVVSRVAPASNMINPAKTQCDSVNEQLLGPGWNGTFSSNSPDGAYVSETRSCTWTIQALNSSTGGVHGVPYIVAINFTTPIQLICGTDYLTLYDGPDTSSPLLARICGNVWIDKIPTFYSTGPQLTAVFSSQANSPGTYGFTAAWSSVAPCSVCVPSGRGTCTNSNSCNCDNRYSGAACELETAGYKDFTPRSQHAMVYDPSKDIVYIMGGRSLRNPYMWDMIIYSFESNKWNKIILNTKSPEPRYGHFGFIHKDDLYIYGGVTVIGALSDVWKFNGKAWTQQQPINPEQLPNGRIGSACVVVTNNNSTKLYVFGGLSVSGTTTRELYTYDIELAMWKKSEHQNSVGLAGATAVYHKATDSIYYFGGMVNHSTRNVITYQYRISQDLWYALAPRVDPFTSTAAPWTGEPPLGLPSHNPQLNNGTSPDNSDESDGEDDDSSAHPAQNVTAQFYPPVLYDQVTAVWAPAALMDDDTVVMFGGMRPYGPGISNRDQTCLLSSFAIYDLSCHKWTTYDISQLNGGIRGRVNHTMVLRPPGSPGGNKTAWTAYIFGGFDGSDRADMISIPLGIPTPLPATVNSCRALRWCSQYDDCQYCNPSYCSYVNGLCLFDVGKAKDANLLVGSSDDIPKTGTVQDLIRQQPGLKNQVQPPESCPPRTGLDLSNPHSGTIQSGQEQTFRIYIDATDFDIQFEIRSLPASALHFKSLNVWEGFMNMYWRATHALTDDTWNGSSETSSPIPTDIPLTSNNISLGDMPVITSSGTLNTSELMSRWTKYSGLDASGSSSALSGDSTYVYFPASDPRRISGYYVFSLTNPNPTAVQYSITVTLLDHPTPADTPHGNQFNMATLGFFMIGFIVAIIVLIVVARKIRQLIEDRDASHRAVEMQLIDDDDDAGTGRRGNGGSGLNGGMMMIQMDGSALAKKPFYRIVVGVQDLGKEAHSNSGSTLRHRIPRRKLAGSTDSGLEKDVNTASVVTKGSSQPLGPITGQQSKESTVKSMIPRSMSETAMALSGTLGNGVGSKPHEGKGSSVRSRRSRVKSDYIRDIGSAPLPMLMPEPNQKSPSRPEFSLSSPDLVRGSTLEKAISQKPLGLQSSPLQSTVSGGESKQTSQQSSKHSKRDPGETEQSKAKEENAALLSTRPQEGGGGEGLQRGWSLKGLSRVTSLRRSNTASSRKVSPEEESLTLEMNQGLTSLEEENRAPNVPCIDTNVGNPTHSLPNGYDSEQEMVDLSGLASPTDLLRVRNEQLKRLKIEQQREAGGQGNAGVGAISERRFRNPARVQPISIEPLPFHSGLVPRTLTHFRRFQRTLSRNRRRQRRQQLMMLQQQERVLEEQRRQQQQQQQQQRQGLNNSNSNSSRSVNSFGGNVDPLSTPLSRFIDSQVNNSSGSMIASRNHPTASFSSSSISSTASARRQPPKKPQEEASPRRKRLKSTASQGSLREIHMKAARMTSRTKGGSSSTIRLHQDLEHANPTVTTNLSSEQGQLGQPCDTNPISSSGIELRPIPGVSKHVDSRSPKDAANPMGEPSALSIKTGQALGPTVTPKRKPIRMRGRQEYEPGPLLAVNILIVFPGDSGSRRVRQQGEDDDHPSSRNETITTPSNPDQSLGTLSGNEGAEQTPTHHSANGSEVKLGHDHEKSGGEEEVANESNLYSQERRLPPMAIGTVFVPDPVRWWAYRAKLQQDRQKYERELRQLHKQEQLSPPAPPTRKGYFRSKAR